MLLDQLQHLPAFLEAELPFDGAHLLAGLRSRAADAELSGRRAEADFLRALIPHVEAAMPRSARAGAQAPTTPRDLLDRLLAFDSPLDQYLCARRHPELAAAAPSLLQSWFGAARHSETDRHAAACAVIGVIWGGPEARVLGRLFWSVVLRRRGATGAARRHLDRAEPDSLASGVKVRLQWLGARMGLAEASGQLEEAVRRAKEGLIVAEAHGQTPAAQAFHRTLAGCLRSLGRTGPALSHVDSALAMLPDHSPLADLRSELLNLRGLIHEDQGEYDLGAADYGAASAEAQRAGDERRRFTAETNRAASLWKAGRVREALRAFEHLLAQARRQQRVGSVSATLNNMGQLRLEMGDAAGARECFRDAINARPTLPQGDRSEIISLFGLGDASAALGDNETAEVLYTLALTTGVTAGHYEDAIADYALRGQKGENKDRAAYLGALVDAYEQSSWPARPFVGSQLAHEIIVDGRHEDGRRMLLDLLEEASTRAPDSLACLHLRTRFAAELAGALGDPRSALAEFQHARRHVQQLLTRAQIPERRAELISEHFSVYEGLLALLVGNPDGLGLDPREAWRLAFDLHEEAKAPTTLARLSSAPLRSDEVEALLAEVAPPAGMTFVSFFCGSEYTYCFIIGTNADLRATRVRVGRGELQDAAEQLRRIFNGDPKCFPPLAPLRPRSPQRRSITFLDALGPRLTAFVEFTQPQTLICASPHGPLHLLPLHALPMADGTRLVERNCVTYCPSLSSLAPALRRISPLPRDGRALFVGVAAQEDPNPALFQTDGALLEAAGWNVTRFTGTDAQPSVVLQALDTVDVAHFTCHGYTDPVNPLESGLVLSPHGTRVPPTKHVRRLSVAQRSDTLLRPSQLLDLESLPALLTLRACSSAWQAEMNRGDEFAGLTRVLLQVGARSVLSTLWNVDQESSGRFVSALYARIHADPGSSLWTCYWHAQKELLGDTDAPWLAHPYHFAPMVLHGDWR